MSRLRAHPILRSGVLSFANRSRAWDQILAHDGGGVDADLLVGILTHHDYVHGAFERGDKGPDGWQRGSGGGVAYVSPGSIWVQLVLANPSALVPCTADKLLNRYVRPLLRAMTRVSGVPVSYFGRDWLSAAHSPVAMVTFAHDTSSGQALFEAFLGVEKPFSEQDRPSFMGKKALSLVEAASGKAISSHDLAEAIVSSYSALATDVDQGTAKNHSHQAPWPTQGRMPYQPRWTAEIDEAIGTIGAGRDADGKMRVGGELMASRDAITRLEEAIATLPANATEEDIGRIVDDAVTSRGAVVFGVRSLASIRDVIAKATRA